MEAAATSPARRPLPGTLIWWTQSAATSPAASSWKACCAAGVNEDSTVIVYSDTNNWFAAWGAWVLDGAVSPSL